MSNKTGFFRVSIAHRRGKPYFKYQIRNELVRREILKKDIYELKEIVESYGFLWGIVDINKAIKYKGKYSIKTLQGKYGEQVGD